MHTTPAEIEQATDGERSDKASTTGQTGSILFAELVRVHYEWERSGASDGELERRYRRKLEEFQECEGQLQHAYWATRRPSAVALTVKPKAPVTSLRGDRDATIRLHRLTDWLARERRIADLLHHSDTLAIKVSEVLRGTAKSVAMQWLYTVQSHLLGFVERTQGRAPDKELAKVVDSQTRELIQIERYYARAGEQAARISYFWGMMIGVVVSGLLASVLAAVLWSTGWFDQPHTRAVQTFFICYIAGGLGAIISVLMRMSSNKFRLDYEVGRATIRRLGSFRPFIGAVFGVALYFLLKSGIPKVELPKDSATTFFFFGVVAFLSGFNERWANVLFGKAERSVAASLEGQTARIRPEDEDEE